MAEINPRNTPIALVLAGAIIISAAISAYAYGKHDMVLTVFVTVGFIIGLVSIIAGAWLEQWESEEHRKWSVNP